jgi:hypothetical protein
MSCRLPRLDGVVASGDLRFHGGDARREFVLRESRQILTQRKFDWPDAWAQIIGIGWHRFCPVSVAIVGVNARSVQA